MISNLATFIDEVAYRFKKLYRPYIRWSNSKHKPTGFWFKPDPWPTKLLQRLMRKGSQ